MTERITTKLPKWPFLLADVSLLVLAGFIVYQSVWPLGLWQIGLSLAAVSLGACLCVTPFLYEFRLAGRVAEAHALSTALAQIKNLEAIQGSISDATGRWLTVQEHSARTVQAAKEIAEQFKADAQEACAFLQKANDREKAHLKLEVEKLRRTEKEWLQTTVHILDHVFALHQAAVRSGQPRLVAQLNQFQQACRDAARRLGLAAFAPSTGEPADPALHQLADSNINLTPDRRVNEILAPGFTFQGQLIRKALVSVKTEPNASPSSAAPSSTPTFQTPLAEAQDGTATTRGIELASGAGQRELLLDSATASESQPADKIPSAE